MARQICTTCYFHGNPKEKSIGFLEVLCWIFLTPVMVLLAVFSSKNPKGGVCPKCNNRSLIPSDTPRGQEILQKATSEDVHQVTNAALEDAPSIEPTHAYAPIKKTLSPKLRNVLIALFVPYAFITTGLALPYSLCALVSILLVLPPVREKVLVNTPLENKFITFIVVVLVMGTGGHAATVKHSTPPDSLAQRQAILADASKHTKEAAADTEDANSNDSLYKAQDACKREISKFFGATGASSIPDSRNWGTGNEFEFAWPKGNFQLTTPAGSVDMSASCNVRKKPMKVMWLTINGKSIIQDGQRTN